jgi:hypothetical protein
MVATVNGHTMEGAWAMVLLYDHHRGIDFAAERLEWRSEMFALTRENVESYLAAFGDRDWDRIDFRAFSKAHNPALEQYRFSFAAVLGQQKPATVPAAAAGRP